jgi:N-acylneuraminate cytidylyltransferase
VTRAVAIIPARGGSRGIPRKNVVDFCGRPLVAWSVLQALSASRISGTYVSSDSREILDVAVAFGAKPIERPASLAGDRASSESAWRHALDEIEATDGPVDLIVGMQPTSPVREASDLDAALEQFEREDCDSMLSCCELADFFLWANPGDGPRGINHDYQHRKLRQVIDTHYLENGSFYIFKPKLLRDTDNRLGGRIGLFVMPKYKSWQIDDVSDLALLGAIMRGYGLDRRDHRP